jgi:hypothetical protein
MADRIMKAAPGVSIHQQIGNKASEHDAVSENLCGHIALAVLHVDSPGCGVALRMAEGAGMDNLGAGGRG